MLRKKIFLLGVCCLLLAVSAAYSDYLFIPARAFHGDAQTVDYDSYETRIWMETSGGYLVAPVYLPQGAVVDGVFLFYKDNGTGYIRCELMRVNPDADGYVQQFPITTSGASPDVQHAVNWAVTAGTRTINNAVFTYYIRLYFSSSATGSTDYSVYGVRIHYH